MRSLRLGGWAYWSASGQLALSANAAAMLTGAPHWRGTLDDFLHHVAGESAAPLRAALLACVRDGVPVDAKVQLTRPGATPRWVRLLGEYHGADPIHGLVQDISQAKAGQAEAGFMHGHLATTPAGGEEAFVTLDHEGRITYIDSSGEALLGRLARELLATPVEACLVGQADGLLQARLQGALGGDSPTEFDDFYPTLGRWLQIRLQLYGEGLAMHLRDVSERHWAQKQLMLLQASVAHLNDLVLIVEVVDDDWRKARVAFVNEAGVRLTGLSHEALLGQDPQLLSKGVGAQVWAELIQALFESNAHSLKRRELRLQRPDGSAVWIDLDVVPVRGPDDQLTHWVAVGRDVSDRKLADDKIYRLAFTDPLTGLPNRPRLLERLVLALAESRRTGRMGALLLIGMDHFKILNESLGHLHGDRLLQGVARRLAGSVQAADVVARIGGDEFVLLLHGLSVEPMAARAQAHDAANRVLALVREPFDMGDYQHHCTASIGITVFDGWHGGVSEVLKQADMATHQAKGLGRDTAAFFEPEMQQAVKLRAELSADLRAALDASDQLGVHYQPLFDRSRRIIGLEALARWRHPARGWISPAEFIPIAEGTGLILRLGHWVLGQACAQLAAWAAQPATAALSVSVNVSMHQLHHHQFVEQVMALMQTHQVKPQLLKLELTESVLADRVDGTLQKMDELKRAGVTLSLDDFGTGYSSLAYLKSLPLDQLKIDQRFVVDVLTDRRDAAIARAVVELGHSLGLSVVAEGVESEGQYQFLQTSGCDLFQGFLLARPMPLEALEEFIARGNGVELAGA